MTWRESDETNLEIVGTAIPVGRHRLRDCASHTRKPGSDTSRGAQGYRGGMRACAVSEGSTDNILGCLGALGRHPWLLCGVRPQPAMSIHSCQTWLASRSLLARWLAPDRTPILAVGETAHRAVPGAFFSANPPNQRFSDGVNADTQRAMDFLPDV